MNFCELSVQNDNEDDEVNLYHSTKFLNYFFVVGAELFAKRRKRSEKWVVGETNGTQPPTLADIPSSPAPTLSPLPPLASLPTPTYSPEATQRAQHNQKLDEIQVCHNQVTIFS